MISSKAFVPLNYSGCVKVVSPTAILQMRNTEKVSVWPVGLVGKLMYESPILKDGKVSLRRLANPQGSNLDNGNNSYSFRRSVPPITKFASTRFILNAFEWLIQFSRKPRCTCSGSTARCRCIGLVVDNSEWALTCPKTVIVTLSHLEPSLWGYITTFPE